MSAAPGSIPASRGAANGPGLLAAPPLRILCRAARYAKAIISCPEMVFEIKLFLDRAGDDPAFFLSANHAAEIRSVGISFGSLGGRRTKSPTVIKPAREVCRRVR